MSKMTISYPGGSGGNWVSNLVYCLEKNISPSSVDINFHDEDKSSSIVLTHKVDDLDAVFLNGKGLFNIYLNVIKKFRVAERGFSEKAISDQFELLASEASSKLFFLDERTDLNWDNIFVDSDSFISDLFTQLDAHDIVHTKNADIGMLAIENYKKSCVDPTDYFDNWDNIIWLGWCNGISKHLWFDWPIVNTIEEMQDFLSPKREFYKDYTLEYTINI